MYSFLWPRTDRGNRPKHKYGRSKEDKIPTFISPFFITKSEFLCNPLLGVTILHFVNLVPSHLLLIGWRNSVFRLMLVSIIMIMFCKIWGQKLGVTRDRGGPFCTKRGRPCGQKAQWLLQNINLLIVEGSQCIHCWHLAILAIGCRTVACFVQKYWRNSSPVLALSYLLDPALGVHFLRVSIAPLVHINLFLNTLQTGDD